LDAPPLKRALLELIPLVRALAMAFGVCAGLFAIGYVGIETYEYFTIGPIVLLNPSDPLYATDGWRYSWSHTCNVETDTEPLHFTPGCTINIDPDPGPWKSDYD